MLEGHVALDSGALIEMLEATAKGAKLLDAVRRTSVIPHTSLVNIAETEYVLCRKVGHASAAKRIDALIGSRYISIEDDIAIHRAASEIKCSRALSLADCYTLAVAEATSSTPVFANEERELTKEMQKKPFARQPVFLE